MTPIILTILFVLGIVALYAVLRRYIIDSIGELKYTLRQDKETLEIVKENNDECYQKELEKEIEVLEKQIKNHWGRKFVKGDFHSSWNKY